MYILFGLAVLLPTIYIKAIMNIYKAAYVRTVPNKISFIYYTIH